MKEAKKSPARPVMPRKAKATPVVDQQQEANKELFAAVAADNSKVCTVGEPTVQLDEPTAPPCAVPVDDRREEMEQVINDLVSCFALPGETQEETLERIARSSEDELAEVSMDPSSKEFEEIIRRLTTLAIKEAVTADNSTACTIGEPMVPPCAVNQPEKSIDERVAKDAFSIAMMAASSPEQYEAAMNRLVAMAVGEEAEETVGTTVPEDEFLSLVDNFTAGYASKPATPKVAKALLLSWLF